MSRKPKTKPVFENTRKVNFSINFVAELNGDYKNVSEISDEDLSMIMHLSFLNSYGAIIECLFRADLEEHAWLDFDGLEKAVVEASKVTQFGVNVDALKLAIKAVSDFSEIVSPVDLQEVSRKMKQERERQDTETS